MYLINHLAAKFVSFWIVFVIARIVVVAQAASDIGILKGILGESLTVGVVCIFAYFLMQEIKKERQYRERRDERIENLTERLIESDEKNKATVQQLIQEIRDSTKEYRDGRDRAVEELKDEIKKMK